MSDLTNPVIQEMLDELRGDWPEIWPLVQQWLEQPCCLHLIHFLNSMPPQVITFADLTAGLGCDGDDVQAALDCLQEHRIVIGQKIPGVETTFYRLNDREPEHSMMVRFGGWCRSWRERLKAAEEVLGVGVHWGEKRRYEI